LEGTSFADSFLAGANFAGADLYGAFVTYSNFSECDLKNACLRGIYTDRTIFWRADLRGADFSLDNLGGATLLQRCDFREITWDETTNFKGAHYDDQTMFPDGFCPQTFGMVRIPTEKQDSVPMPGEGGIFRYENFQKRFFGGDLAYAVFNCCNLTDAVFPNIDCFHADFSLSNLRNAVFTAAKLYNVTFRQTDLHGAKFITADPGTPCNLSGADLYGMIYDETTVFAGALYSPTTRFPDNFDPSKHAMILTAANPPSHWQYMQPATKVCKGNK